MVWVDLETPTETEVRQIMEEFTIDPLVAEGLLITSVKPKMEAYRKYI